MDSQGIAILGSTGSIGCNALSVIESFADERFRVVALAAGRNVERLVAQVERHRPELVAVEDESAAESLKAELERRGLGVPRVMNGEAAPRGASPPEPGRTAGGASAR